MQNWVENISVLMVDYESEECPGCKVHSGFFYIWNSFKDDILPYIKELSTKVKTKNILITGHSLGGAIATIAAFELRLRYGDHIEMINFGSPRVGNEAFAQRYG